MLPSYLYSTNYEGGWTKAVVEDLSSTESVSADKRERHSRAVTAVSAYGTSVALNRTRQRPASARASSAQQGRDDMPLFLCTAAHPNPSLFSTQSLGGRLASTNPGLTF